MLSGRRSRRRVSVGARVSRGGLTESGEDARDVLLADDNDDLYGRVLAVVVCAAARLDGRAERVLEQLKDDVGPAARQRRVEKSARGAQEKRGAGDGEGEAATHRCPGTKGNVSFSSQTRWTSGTLNSA